MSKISDEIKDLKGTLRKLMYLSNRAMYRKDHIMAQLWANRWEDANNQLRSLETKKYEL